MNMTVIVLLDDTGSSLTVTQIAVTEVLIQQLLVAVHIIQAEHQRLVLMVL